MHYYLAPYVGTGTMVDPFRPRGSVQAEWSAIDLRPDGALVDGYCLLSLPDADPDPLLGLLALDVLEVLGAAAKLVLETTLGVTLTASRFNQIVAELLIDHARLDGTRWRPLVAEFGRERIYLGGARIYDQPLLRGGVSISESFNKADSDILGPDLSWTEVAGDWDVVTNAAEIISGGADSHGIARAETDLASIDHYAQATILNTAGSYSGVMCRKDGTATKTYYHFDASPPSTWRTFKRVAGTFTSIGADTTVTIVAGDVIRGEAEGSTIRRKRNGVLQNSITDTAITTGLRCGILAQTNLKRLDDFSAADLAAPVSLVAKPTPMTALLVR